MVTAARLGKLGPKNKPQLTPAGQDLLPELTAALDQIEAAVGRVRDTATGTLDVSVHKRLDLPSAFAGR